ncbi:MAG: TIGR01777 family protein [Gammaproteobacteria bacterium]|nr:TIGR01777 family protein [Gammaproteobacteria bacterium]
MRIILAGATGFVGRNLVPALLKEHHELVVIGRSANKIAKVFGPTVTPYSWNELDTLLPDSFDAIINLAGENIGESRWSDRIKKKIKDSRVHATQKLVAWAARAEQKKPHLYNTSAIGIYGRQPVEEKLPPPMTEAHKIHWGHPSDFLSEVTQAWEEATKPAVSAGIPVTLMRFAVVLKRWEGVLKKLEPSFWFGLGSRLGSGCQPFSWIHIHDLVYAILFLLQHPEITGPVNLCAPECVTQKAFAKELARVMHRPLCLTMPAFVIKILFGQMGEELLLGGQNVIPERLKQLGFKFSYPTLASALR